MSSLDGPKRSLALPASTRAATVVQAPTRKPLAFNRAKDIMVKSQEELMGPVNAFGNGVIYLPSIPSSEQPVTDCAPLHNALHEMVVQSRLFLYGFAKGYQKLLEMTRRETPLGVSVPSHYADDILAVVRVQLSPEDIQTLADRAIALRRRLL